LLGHRREDDLVAVESHPRECDVRSAILVDRRDVRDRVGLQKRPGRLGE
jgi:hypothetical protein